MGNLATKTDGTLWAWGSPNAGQLGLNQGGALGISSPTQIPGTTWSTVSAGERNMAAIKTDGTLWCWGQNLAGELGVNDRTNRSSPVQVPGTTWSTISEGGGIILAKKSDSTLWTWGPNSHGSLGQNQSYPVLIGTSSPVQIPGIWGEVGVISAAYNNIGWKYG